MANSSFLKIKYGVQINCQKLTLNNSKNSSFCNKICSITSNIVVERVIIFVNFNEKQKLSPNNNGLNTLYRVFQNILLPPPLQPKENFLKQFWVCHFVEDEKLTNDIYFYEILFWPHWAMGDSFCLTFTIEKVCRWVVIPIAQWDQNKIS